MTSKFLSHLRMAAFPLGLGLTSVLVSGTLNRVMIVELDIPAALVGLFFALPLLISPLRIWLGYRSDAHPLWGLRREPFIIFGALISGLGIAGAALAVLKLDGPGLVISAAAAFLAYGIGKNLSSNTFEALISDKFTGDQRPRAVTFYKVAMFAGIMSAAILLGRLLDPFSTQRLWWIVLSAVALAFSLAVGGVLRQEPRKDTLKAETRQVRERPFAETFKTLIWQDPQIRRFFIFVMLTVIGTLAQDVLLEPYAALVLGMSVGQTTSLTAIWGAGTLLSMAVTGMWLIKRFGYVRVVRVGLLMGMVTFAGLILAGFLRVPGLFLGLVFCLGLSTGLSASGMLTAVIEFTTSTRAGLLMGVWGVAHNLGQAAGGLISGAVVDLVRLLNGDALAAYGTVFALEAGLLLLALFTLNRVKIAQARAMQENQALNA
jgi:BCD family chlorophyll transporter-like MFS transporter